MSQLLRVEPPVPSGPPDGPDEENEPFRYGWRYLPRTLPDGTITIDIVPLRFEDLLYPEEDDYVVQKPPHTRDFIYCHGSLETHHAADTNVVVLGDCRVDWGVAGIRPLGPDILVLFGVRFWLQHGTFRIGEEGGQPILVLEITSPSTWVNDVGPKIDLYYRAGVQLYVILDRGPRGEDPAQLRGYKRGPNGWIPLEPDAQGRLNLAPVTLLLGLEDDHPWFYVATTGQRLPNLTEAVQARSHAEAKARDEALARSNAEAKARDEALARLDAEAKARDAELKAREAVQARADAEAKVRDAEAKTRQEAAARAALEKRLRELEEQLQRPSEEA